MADVRFYCSKCGKHLVVDARAAGLTVACPGCGISVRVPPPEPAGAPVPVYAQAAVPSPAVPSPAAPSPASAAPAAGPATPRLMLLRKQDELSDFIFQGGDVNGLSHSLSLFFAREGYRLEEGTTVAGVYGKGSTTARIFLGAFVERAQFRVAFTPLPNGVRLILSKAMTGFSGGVIGMMAYKREYLRVVDRLEAHFGGAAAYK